MQIKLILTVLLSTMVIFPESLKAEQVNTILFLGDSLTAGYGIEQSEAFPNQLRIIAESEGKKVKIINAGMSGDTSAGALRRLPWYLKNKIDICLVALGANDGLRGLQVPALKGNLISIIDKIREVNPNVRIVIAGMQLPENFGEPYRSDFQAIFAEVSKEKNTLLIPFLLEGVAGHPELNLEDRLHPSEGGHKLIAKNVWEVIKSLITK